MFLRGALVGGGLWLFFQVAWKALILGCFGLFLVHTTEPKNLAVAPTAGPDQELIAAAYKGEVKIVSIRQSGDQMIAQIRNQTSARVYNLHLSCDGGPSRRDYSGWLNAGETQTRTFDLMDGGAHTDCVLGYNADFDQDARKHGQFGAYEDALETVSQSDGDGAMIEVSGTIANFGATRMTGAKLICYYSTEDNETEVRRDIDVTVNSKARGAISGQFYVNIRPQNGVFCKTAAIKH